MKRTLSLILTAAIILAMFIIVPTTFAGALQSGDFQYEVKSDGTARITKYTGTGPDVTIPKYIGGKKVSSLSGSAFVMEYRLKTIDIQAEITEIENNSFSFSGLTSVKFPSTLTSIGSQAFSYCGSLADITIPDSVVSIGSGAFSDCYSIKSINIPGKLKTISSFAFSYCDLSSLTIPGSVTAIESCAFYGNSNLKSVAIPKTVTSIGDFAFGYCADAEHDIANKDESHKYPGFSISGYPGTAAETYANQNDIPFKSLFPLSAPKISKLENTTAGVKVTVGKVSGAVRYRVFYNIGKGWVFAGDTTTTSFTHKNPTSGKKYTYTVRCVSKNGKTIMSDFNHTGWAITFVATPKAPKLANSKSGVKLAGTAVKGAAKYRIFRKTGSGKWIKLADVTKPVYCDKKAKSGVTYRYTLRCLNKNGKYVSAYNNGTAIKCKR